MKLFPLDQAARTAAELLKDGDVATALTIAPEDTSRLALALVADADIAAEFAADLLTRYAGTVAALEEIAMCATARPDYDGDTPVITFELDATTRKCTDLVAALKLVAAERPHRRSVLLVSVG